MASVDRLLRRVIRLLSRDPGHGMDDATLTRKVESILVLDAAAPKGRVVVSAVEGVVELRGDVRRPADARSLEAHARAIPEVRDVRNRLHLPKAPSA
jgi:osmotically-inducible protein OsmY